MLHQQEFLKKFNNCKKIFKKHQVPSLLILYDINAICSILEHVVFANFTNPTQFGAINE